MRTDWIPPWVGVMAVLACTGCPDSNNQVFDYDRDGVSDNDDCEPDDPTVHPGDGWDCDDRDPVVGPEWGC